MTGFGQTMPRLKSLTSLSLIGKILPLMILINRKMLDVIPP